MNSCAFIIPKDASHLLPNHATKTVHRDFLGTHYSQVWQESKMSSQCHWKKIQNLREILETGLVNGDEKKVLCSLLLFTSRKNYDCDI